jgi:hypothetical protein
VLSASVALDLHQHLEDGYVRRCAGQQLEVEVVLRPEGERS